MRNLIFCLLATVMIISCDSRKGDEYVIKGTILGDTLEQVYLQQSREGKFEILDSALVEDGKFKFTGTIAEPDLYYIGIDESRYASFFNEAASIKIIIHTDSLMKPVVTGSVSDKQYRDYLSFVENQRSVEIGLFSALKEANRINDSISMKKIEQEIEANDVKQKEDIMDYIKANNASFVAPYAAVRHAYLMELEDMENVLASLDSKVTGSTFAKTFTDRIEKLRNVAVGKVAPDFTMNDINGNPVSLSQLKGKVLLVDFWAAWCGPCRDENPNVVDAYTKYKDKGFDVLGVSLDRDKEAWKKAIADDKLSWTQVSDLLYWQNAAAKLYAISSIPSNVLLDKDGVIIARNLRGEDLQKKLAELFPEVK